MIEPIDNRQMPIVSKDSSSLKSKPAGSDADSVQNASLEVSYAPLLEKAKAPQREDITAVERAKQLLKSGQLDSPENIRSAAKNMVEFGI